MADIWEYTQMRCDVWQMSRLAARWGAEYGWEVVAVVPLPDMIQGRLVPVPSLVGDENSPDRDAVRPVEVLFRRRADVELCGHKRGVIHSVDHYVHAYDGAECDSPPGQ